MATPLPTWDEIAATTLDQLAAARASADALYRQLSDASDTLRSDWRPVGSALSTEAAAARSQTWAMIGDAKGDINELKNKIGAARDALDRTIAGHQHRRGAPSA